ncbi:MAG: hypothetical protein HRT88_06405 [Lentisphaeraceae bacterium]|nr:hypothetical protein [Lentisphaeraceae bacterium]
MKQLILLVVVSLLMLSCVQFEAYNYPGDKFSRTPFNAPSSVVEEPGAKVYTYLLDDKKVVLTLARSASFFVDDRSGQEMVIPVEALHYGKRIDSSLRYFIRGGMTLSELRLFLGEEHEKWGSVGNTMAVWHLADGRKLAIIPSTLSMPEGMQSYNLLNEYGKLDRVVKIPVLGIRH